MKISQLEHKILNGLLLYMPFHYYICELLFKQTSVDNAMRDVVILFLLACSIAKNGLKLRVNTIDISVTISICALIMFAIISFLANGYPAKSYLQAQGKRIS